VQCERGVEIVDAAIIVAMLGWCAKTLWSMRRNGQLDAPDPAKPIARMTNEITIETLSDPLGRV
jgi:hypothetical protein